MTDGRRFRFGDFTLDVARRALERDGAAIALQPKVFATLVHLVERAGTVVTKEQLLADLWPDTAVGDAVLTRCVRQIRQALSDDTRAPRFVRTVPRVGFQFVAEVAERPAAAARPAPSPGSRSLAVLPLRPLRGEDRDESLELGMTDSLIMRLSGLRGLVIRSLSTVRAFADLGHDALEAGRELDVDVVLDGSLQRVDERIRVSVRLLEVSTGRALVADEFEESFENVFAVQDAICRRIAQVVAPELSGEESRRIEQHGTDSAAAYEHYLAGRLALGRVVPGDAPRAITHFERALAEDPRYALALTSLGEAWIIRASAGIDTQACYSEARRAAEAALELDGTLGGAWACLATANWQYDWNWAEADGRFRRAVELTPDVVDIWCSWSSSCSFTCRYAEGIAHAERARTVDPASPMAGAWLAQALYMAGEVEAAAAEARKTLARAPGFPFALFFLGLCSLAQNRAGNAVEWLEQASGIRPDFAGALGLAYLRAGREQDAKRIETAIESVVAAGLAPSAALAPLYAGRDDRERLFAVFEQAMEARTWHVLLLASEPLLEPFRSDPRAVELIRRIGLDVA